MKRMILIMSMVFSSVTLAGYDFVVGDGGLADLTLEGHQTLLMTGGAADSLSLMEWSSATILNTSPYSVYPTGGIRELGLGDYSHLEFYGGDVFEMNLGSFSTAALYGGKIQTIRTGQSAWKYEGQPPVIVPNPHIEIMCRDWLYNAANKRLTGTWGDYSTFNIKLIDVQGYSPTIDNIRFTIIPEPMTMLLLGIGGLLVRQKRVIG
jgi:hypothetical protein